MQVYRQLLNFYINSSIHVGLAVYALTYVTLIELGIPKDTSLLFFVFFATITGYNFVKFFGLAKFHHRSLAGWLKSIQVFSLFCFVLMCYYLLYLPTKTLIYIALFGVVTFFYAIPLLPKRIFIDKYHNLRSIAGLKVYVIALVWTGVTVFLPVCSSEFPVNTDVIITAVQRFIFVVVLMLPFEIRDLKFDSVKLSTIPQKIGVKLTKIFGVILIVLMFLAEFFKDKLNSTSIAAFTLTLVAMVLLLLFARVYQNKYYSAFWVEGVPILWLLLVFLMS